MEASERIARIKITLDHFRPAIWRRVEVPLTSTLKALHDVIQAAMPFDDYHLFEFRAGDRRYAIPDPEWDSLRDRTYSAKTVKLGKHRGEHRDAPIDDMLQGLNDRAMSALLDLEPLLHDATALINAAA